MKVKFASQVLSNTVASGMLSLYSSGALSSNSGSFINTAEFVSFFNKLFDILNSSFVEAIVPTKKVFVGSPEQLEFLDEAEKILKTIRVVDELENNTTNNFNFLKGWVLNINSLRRLWRFLSHSGFPYLKTRRLCQDSLEHFFGQIRSRGGTRVTPYMFSSLFRKSWGLRYVNIVTKGNCELPLEPDATVISEHSNNVLLNVCNDSLLNDLSWQDFQGLPRPEHFLVRSISLDSTLEINFLKENAFSYFCGYLYLKIFKMHSCSLPLPYLGDEIPSDEFIFIYQNQIDKCNLVKPPQEFVAFVKVLETKFLEEFDSNCHKIGIGDILFNEMKDVRPFLCCENCDPKIVIALFIRIRIYFVIKFLNKELSVPNFKNKILCVSHL